MGRRVWWSLSGCVVVIAALGAPAQAQEPPGGAVTAPPVRAPEPDPHPSAADEALDGLRFTLHFPDTPLYEVTWFLRDVLAVPVLVDAAADLEASIEVEVKEVTAREALQKIAAEAGLELKVWRGFVVLCRPERELPEPPDVAQDATGRSIASQRVSMELDETPLEDAAGLLSDVIRCPVRVAAGVGELRVCLRVQDLPGTEVLSALAAMTGLTWRIEAGEVVFDQP